MNKEENSKNKKTDNSEVEKVKSLLGKNRAAALGLAVMLVLGTPIALSGCGRNDDEEDDDSYYIGGYNGGGSYFYTHGGSYKSGSWGKNFSLSSGSKGYSSVRGGSVGS